VRVLALNHTFAQDLDSLRRAGGAAVDIRTLELDLVHTEAMRVLPADIDDDASFYSRPEYEPNRQRLAEVLEGLFADLFREREFDLFVTPSDVYYYLRPAPAILHRLGVPYFVAERETTVSPHIMQDNVELLGRWFPPIADHRTLCSRRLRDFWVQTGADPSSITVTGQPRFDFYRQPERWPQRLPYGQDARTVLFLSYDYNAYHPDGSVDSDVWAQQHHETETGLWELARRGWRVLVKPHPQQARRDRERLKHDLGPLFGKNVFFVHPNADTRELMVGSDVIVGFQTTALFEAMVAQKPIVYAGWSARDSRAAESLIQFRQWGEVVNVVEDPAQLVATVEHVYGQPWDEARIGAARGPIEENIGVCDGQASERTLAAMRECVERFRTEHTAEVRARRAGLSRKPPPVRLRRRTVYGYKRLRRRAGALLGR
jgi:hypothetical protein